MLDTQILDEVRYAEVSDVSVFIRNQTFDASSDPTRDQVKRLITLASDLVDNRTWRAWRTRKLVDRELKVLLTHEQDTSRYRRMSGRGMRGARRTASRTAFSALDMPDLKWVIARAPHMGLQDWDTSKDKIEALYSDRVDDITADQGRDVNGGYVVNEQTGIFRIDRSVFSRDALARPRVRVTYRYGKDESTNDPANGGDGVSDSVPGEITLATAKLVAADLIHTDQYGSLITSGPENTPDQSTAAGKLWAGAMETVKKYKRKPTV